MPEYKSLKKPLLSQEVKDAIQTSIADETFKPGEKLPSERELVDQFQVSRVTIREALRNLQSAGLIEIRRGINAGAYVSEPNSDPITENFRNLIHMGRIGFSHLIDARLYIEPRASEIAAKYATDKDIDRLQKVLDKAAGQVATSRKSARLTNVSFHVEVAKITKNPIILFITESITQSYSATIIELTRTQLRRRVIQKFILGHREILAAIVKHNPAEAYEMTRRHLLDTYQAYTHVLPDDQVQEIDRRIQQENHCWSEDTEL
ncbi:GntR family transcriptional regulator [Desulfosarcina widdelii]|uniref:GntR family transcriptional regulator n=1 Tax=Desulfosarcina widdelii TaxID=947919 RepID=A0A5K7Z0D1_9BACT|nr:FadR/GntR family transcriptional regulator [Desulfosarcina widdelii]BBO73613.1 GntR family transcriptional regulator [Desulfosarcina widdelii]